MGGNADGKDKRNKRVIPKIIIAARLLVAFLPLASAGLRSYFAKLPFNARDPPAHTTDISVGVYFEHLFKVNQKEHTFDADFWLVYKWHDGRNFSHLFFGDDGNYLDHVEVVSKLQQL